MINLEEMLELHYRWLCNRDKGVKADLQYVNLQEADLQYVNLHTAALHYTDLRNADLWNAALQYADSRNAEQIPDGNLLVYKKGKA